MNRTPSPTPSRVRRWRTALRAARERVVVAVAWSRAQHDGSGLAVRAVALLALAGLVASLLVVGVSAMGGSDPARQAGAPEPVGPPERMGVPPSAQTAVDMAGRMRSLNEEERAAVARARVIPHRSARFLKGLDAAAETNSDRWRSLEATPVAYHVVGDNGSDAYVSVLSRVERAPSDPGTDPTAAWDLSSFGVISKWDRWWVFVYAGSTSDVEPGDPELEEFTRLP